MTPVLVCLVIFTNLMEVALPISFTDAYSSFNYVIESCKPENAVKWSNKVTINESKGTELSTEHKSKSKHAGRSSNHRRGFRLAHTTPKPASEGYMGVFNTIASFLTNPFLKTTENLKEFQKMVKRQVAGTFQFLCSPIPEPIVMPDLDLMSPLKFKAFNGSISGVRELCERFGQAPVGLTNKGMRGGVKYELPLHGLHFHYHVIDKNLGINHNFNWTLGEGSAGEVSFLIGFSFPCVLTMEDIDLRLDFDGTDGNKKCVKDCYSILQQLECYLYYSMAQAFQLLAQPLKDVSSSFACLSFKRMELQELSKTLVKYAISDSKEP